MREPTAFNMVMFVIVFVLIVIGLISVFNIILGG